MRNAAEAERDVQDLSGDRGTRRVVRLLGIVAIIGILQVGFLIFVELDRFTRHRAAISELETELALTQAEADALRAIAERAFDTDFREQLARRQGFMFPTERRLIVLNEGVGNVTSPARQPVTPQPEGDTTP